MNKSLIIAAALMAAASTADAKEVSAVRAREIAASVIPSIGTDASPRRAPGVKDDAASPYYMFNAQGGNGYVIVAGDDRLPAVLGYSRQGEIDPDNLPEAMQFLLEMSAISAGAQEEGAMLVTAGTPVVNPLLGEINWGQSEPFNTLCPMVGGNRGYVGCVATAMAQIMRFWSYPAKGTGSHSYTHNGQTLSADFGAASYDWANMPKAIPSSPTDEQTLAYSTLCAHLGIATNMQYSKNGSGAYTMDVPGALREYFGYTPSLRMHSRTYYSTDEWMGMIRAELDAGRPVYYSASSEDGLGGHAFVCDGYDSEGYVHINWGWYGDANGYFYINHLNPDELGTGGGGGAYNIDQEILTHFMPALKGDLPAPAVYGNTRFSCDSYGLGMTITTYLCNLDTSPFNGEMLAVVTSEDGEILRTLKSESVTVPQFSNGYSGSLLLTMREVPTATDLPNGKYRLKLAYKSAEMDTPELLRHPIGLAAYRECNVIGGQIMLAAKHEPSPNVTMTTALEPDGEVYAQGSAIFNVSLRNDSEDFRLSNVVLTLTSADDASISYSKEYYVNVYELSSADFSMAIDLPDNIIPGTYRVTLAHRNHLDKPFATFDEKETFIKVLPAMDCPVIRLTTTPIWQNGTTGSSLSCARGDILSVATIAKNYAAEGETMVMCRLVGQDGKASVLKGSKINWNKGEKRTIAISANVAVDPGTYTLAFSYVDPQGLEKPIKVGDDQFPIEITENDATPVEITSFNMPSAMKKGEKSACSITLKSSEAVRGTLYVRLRQFTNTNGELAFMRSGVNLTAGVEQTINFNYSPDLADGNYMTIVEFKHLGASVNLPAGGHSVYYKEIAIGETAGISAVEADDANGPVTWYNIQGVQINAPSAPGLYIRRQGDSSAKILIK